MTLLEFSLSCLLASVLGVVLVIVFHRPSRGHIPMHACMAVATAAALALWRHMMPGTGYGLFTLPIFGALGAGVGYAVGTLLERHTKARNAKIG